jgi:hypothetical protein
MLPPRNTSRPSNRPTAPHRTARSSRLVMPTPTTSARRGERAHARVWHAISFIQLHKRCTERLPNKFDGRLLQYPYGISLFPLALNTWAFNSFIITINGPRPIYFNNPHQKFHATLEMLSYSLLFLIYQYYDGDC